jgi:hypothetical protein
MWTRQKVGGAGERKIGGKKSPAKHLGGKEKSQAHVKNIRN